MAGGKETVRQKMIGMMYLVLTALLALNVSKEVLNAFVTINDALETSKVTFDTKISQSYAGFHAAYEQNKAKYGDAWEKAVKLKAASDSLVHHIDLIKAKTIGETEGIKDPTKTLIGKNEKGVDTVLNLQYVKERDNYFVNTHLMVGAEPDKPLTSDDKDGNNYRAAVLKQKLEAYGKEVRAMIPNNPDLQESVDTLFSFPTTITDASGVKENWESHNFYDVPLAATTAILSKIQADIRTTELDVLSTLFSGVEAKSFKFTTLDPVVISPKTYILTGDTFKAQVFLAAFDATKKPDVYLASEGTKLDSSYSKINVDNMKTLPVDMGKGIIKIPATSIGDKHWEGIINFKDPTGTVKHYRYNFDYEVAKPNLVVSPTKMNVVYRGIDNPVSISVPGVSQEAISASMSNGTLVKQPDGSYIARNIGSGTTSTVSVTATVNGHKKSMGSFEFRVKSVPDPVANFAGKGPADSRVSRSDLQAALGVVANLKDFVFDLHYPVTSFDISLISGNEAKTLHSNSNYLTADQKSLLQQIRKGQQILIENIHAKAPDGTTRNLGSINLKVY